MGKAPRVLQELFDSFTGELRGTRDWTALLQLASETLTIGTLAANVLRSSLEPQLPQNVRELLVEVLARANQRNERLLGQFSEILTALNAAGIEPIAMRGMALLLEQHAAAGRIMSDIDLLVPAAGREASIRILSSLGYQVFQGFHGPPHAVTLGRSQDVGMVDLHTDIQPYFLNVNFERIAPFCRTVETEAGRVLVPTPTCALLTYVLHDQLHDGDYWRGLIDARHLLDIPRLVDEGIDWPTLVSFFPAGCARNALNVQLRTARSFLHIDIPEEYCGGTWAKLQLKRRILQLRLPALKPLLTLLSIAVDPPRNWGSKSRPKRSTSRTLHSRLKRTLGAANPGKIKLRSA